MTVPVILVAVQLVVRRLRWVDTRCPDEVQGDRSLFRQLIPQLERPVAIGRAESTDEVVLVCLNGAFRGVDSVIGRLDKLPLAIFFLKEGLDRLFCTGCPSH